jgi:hypothetical protein
LFTLVPYFASLLRILLFPKQVKKMLKLLRRCWHVATEISATTPPKIVLPFPYETEFVLLPDESIKNFSKSILEEF